MGGGEEVVLEPRGVQTASVAGGIPANDVALNSAEFVEGFRLRISTTLGEDVEGEVLVYDKKSNRLVIQNFGSTGGRRNLRFINANFIKSFEVVGRTDLPPAAQIPAACLVLSMEQLRAREAAAIRQMEIEAERIGVNVSTEAQELFDALGKTYPVRWDATTIVVMDEVRVGPPHLPENVTGGSPAAIERVKKVLVLERRRLTERAAEANG
eukprot:TRINITY_DN6504_c0_g1_i1.p1 TRINITY_DN6504_c0_g1~~TRINITY_DN6504_c0_g1_i1.p1  ORF type:complete len:211 (-),score=43.09 TRINITY_DN6504_c0_g1_i1:326-958(-)